MILTCILPVKSRSFEISALLDQEESWDYGLPTWAMVKYFINTVAKSKNTPNICQIKLLRRNKLTFLGLKQRIMRKTTPNMAASKKNMSMFQRQSQVIP